MLFKRFNYTPENKFLLALGAVTLLGAALRMKGLWTESFTADELDTVIRIKSSRSLHELLDTWVRHDGHPPFTHLLEYFWTALFGFSEGAVRLPFALLGAGATWFAGRTAKLWFSSGAAIAVAAGVAFLQFPLMYSQLARPYAPGLFFSMLFAYYWSKWLFGAKRSNRDLAWLVLAGAGAVYSHYFSLLVAGMIGFSGLFFLRRETWKPYLVACLAILLLFAPYTGIFIFQLSAGGVGGPGGWLGKPTPAFFREHLWFIFDESRGVLYGALAFAVVSLLIFRRRPNKFTVLAFVFWALPLIIGYVYSVKSNPVLQHSVLLFSFPFLLMLLFSGLPPIETGRWQPLLPYGFALALLLFVTSYRPFHLTDHFGRIEEIAATTLEAEKLAGADSVACAFNVDYPYYMGYYWEKLGKPKHVLGDKFGIEDLKSFRRQLAAAPGDYFVYGWSTTYSPLELTEIIREKYPYIVESHYWFNSAVTVFAKEPPPGGAERETPLFRTRNDFSTASEVVWKANSCKVVLRDSFVLKPDSAVSPGGFSLRAVADYDLLLDSACVFSPSVEIPLGELLHNPDNRLFVSSRVRLGGKNSNAVLVLEFWRNGKQLNWNGRETITQTDSTDTNGWQDVYFGLQLPNDLRLTDTVKCYCYWLRGEPLLLDFLELRAVSGHPGIYGPRPDYKE